jgi:hypothetical protein
VEKNQMKKPKRPGRDVNAKRGAKRNHRNAKRNRLAETIKKMATEGLVEDQIALRLGLDKNLLRAKFIDDIKRGRSAAAASEVDAALTQSQYHFLRAAATSFDEGSWIDTDGRNLLFRGVDGKGAKDLADAYAFWASNGERFNTTGLSTKFNPTKAARFAEIVNNYKRGKTDE